MKTLSMAAAAEACGYSYERFRKIWPEKVADEGMPRPFTGRKWDEDALRAWIRDRSALAPQALARAEAPAPAPARAKACREELHELRRMG